jgi:hypothetical protein
MSFLIEISLSSKISPHNFLNKTAKKRAFSQEKALFQGSILEEWMDDSTDPESMIVDPESHDMCTSQNIALEIHNILQPPTTWKGISINLHSNPNYAFILNQASTYCNLLRWDLVAQTQTSVFTG